MKQQERHVKICSDQALLAVYDALPSLLDLATEQAKSTGGLAYQIQNELRDQFFVQDQAFRWSMPYRSLFECFECGLMTTQIQHMLVNPTMRESDPGLHMVDIEEGAIHAIRKHDAAFPVDCRKFLEQVAEQFKFHPE